MKPNYKILKTLHINKPKIMINLLNSKIEYEIANHFQDNFDITETREDYVCEFNFDGAEILVPYTVKHEVLTYKNEWISASKYSESYDIEDSDHFRIRRMDQNPNKRTVQQEIDSIIERAKRVHEENEKSSEAIREHNEYLDLNER